MLDDTKRQTLRSALGDHKVFQAALEHQRAGRFSEAEALCRQLIESRPDHHKALHLLGLIANQNGNHDSALAWLGRAAQIAPSNPEYQYNLGVVYGAIGRRDEAIVCYQRALALRPEDIEALNNLGNIFMDQRKPGDAEGCYRRALAIRPDDATTLSNLGLALKNQDRLDEAIGCYREALAIKADDATTLIKLAMALKNQDRLDEAIGCYKQVVALRPEDADAHNYLGTLFTAQNRLDDALACYRQALAIRPNDAEALNNAAFTLKDQGKAAAAMTLFQRAIAVRSEYAIAHSNKLLTAYYANVYSPDELFAEHLKFSEQFEQPLKVSWRPHDNSRDPDRRLKIGYISPDFCSHAVAYFIEPVLANHDKSQVEIFCYYTLDTEDGVTRRLKSCADHWLPCAHMTDEQLADRIRADGIDILVDLAGHTGGNRLLVFARKPAPMQVTWLGYIHTTGLSAIDYRLTHADADPPNSQRYYSETLYPLPGSFWWCYRPRPDMPEVASAPLLANGYVTFGSTNNFAKLSPETLDTWAQILKAMPDARLLIAGVPEGSARQALIDRFTAQQIDAQRLIIHGRLPVADFWRLHQKIDIVLDPFPHNGGTTTCDALWLGVPVVALTGEVLVSRMGHALLKNLGLPELAGATVQDYVNIAVQLAGDPVRLAALRAGMRDRLAASPLRDEAGFTRRLESAYRDMWRRWCTTGTGAGRPEEAIACYQRILVHRPADIEILNTLGILLRRQGRLHEARDRYQQALATRPDDAATLNNLGNVWKDQHRLDEAIACYRKALALKPDFAEAYSNLGNALSDMDQLDEAVACYRQALALAPDNVATLNNLGNTLQRLCNFDEAITCYRQVLVIRPDFTEAWCNQGVALSNQDKLDEAIACYRKALELNPDHAEAHSNLGNALKDMGMADEALACYHKALAINPAYADAYSNKLMVAQYAALHTSDELFAEHLKYAERFESPLKPFWQPHSNRPDPKKRLKVGYVSPDFRNHSVAYFIGPVLEHHDRTGFEIFCYYTHVWQDSYTDRIKSQVDHWIPCAGMTDAQLAERIRADGIDILVDLAGHTGDNRLRAFARKPAPVQVTYLGYPATTGLSAMDYRLTDVLSDPESEEVYYSEKLVRLPGGFLCYQAPADSPSVSPPPALATGHVTFGSFNNPAKISPEVVALWARLLTVVDDSRLVLKGAALGSPSARERFHRLFEAKGIARERIDLLGRTPSAASHLALYARIDIALDTFPYNGTTTTCEALWMGAPVITLAGQHHAGRVGVSLLNQVGITEWIAADLDQYIALAAHLAANPQTLAALRAGLRQRMADSRLCDGRLFARTIETVYRNIWQKWCCV